MVKRKRLKNTRNGLLVKNRRLLGESMTPMSNYDLIDAAKSLSIKKTLEVFS